MISFLPAISQMLTGIGRLKIQVKSLQRRTSAFIMFARNVLNL